MDNPYKTLARDLETLPGNADKKKTDIQAVAHGERKKPISKKLVSAIFAEDIADIKEYFLYDVLIPALKKAVDETIHSMLYGQGAKNKDNRRDYASYSDYYSRPKPSSRTGGREPRRKQEESFSTEFFFSSRAEAMEVLRAAEDIIHDYGVCSVADLCKLSHVSSDYTDFDYGWYDLSRVPVRPYKGGFILDLPKAHLID